MNPTMNRLSRNLTWLLSTLTVVVLLFGYKTSTGGGSLSADSSAVSSAGTAPISGSSSGSSGSSGLSSDPSSSPSASSGSSSGSSSSAASTVTGDVAQTRWGPVQVAVSVASGKVTDVQVVEYPSDNPRDAEINSYALPILIKETISAQSANIDMVSGATVTSGGYIQSLQSALDQAGV
ncbi:FMN-binding protein [Nocardioides panacihumi]|uniref:FMN-binding protein n=1 Tax=Nocardioides panacihumi TaxID=400774 RepID=UPI0031E1EB75